MSGLRPHSPIARSITGTRAALPLPALHAVDSRCWHTNGFAEIWAEVFTSHHNRERIENQNQR